MRLYFNLSYVRIIPREVLSLCMRKLTKEKAAYIAGFLDGDGSIHVRLKPNDTYRYGFKVAQNIVFYQSQKEQEFLERLRQTVGGGYVRRRNDGIAEYVIGDVGTMRDLISSVLPYLILKKRQAKLLVKIFEIKEKVKNKKDFLQLAKLIDEYQNLNYSKKRTVNSSQVAQSFKQR